mmetsp:Transcript_15388/g.23185  ORF Transcript_15388/g.23185 Transcript_15388/m.23185 type:complete len:149 (+) Transcript_15388:1399-1845(+)
MAILSPGTVYFTIDHGVVENILSAALSLPHRGTLLVKILYFRGNILVFYLSPDMDNVVSAYRELASATRPFRWWNEATSDTFGYVKVLDICCGTGRWIQALAGIVLRDRRKRGIQQRRQMSLQLKYYVVDLVHCILLPYRGTFSNYLP